MAYVIGERVKSRRWARFQKNRLAFLCLVMVLITVFSVSTQGELIHGIKSLSKKSAGQQVQAGGVKKTGTKNKQSSSGGTVASTNTPTGSTSPQTNQCTVTSPELSNFQTSISPEIRKLSEHEKICSGKFISSSMLFTSMPGSVAEASALAIDTARRLKEFAKYGLTPYLILEPVTPSGFVDFKAFSNGQYDDAMNAYFATLKTQGISDQSLGVVVPFPESNIPEWGNVDPSDVAACIGRTAGLQKQHFPGSKTAVLLDSKSYPRPDSWEGGAYVSLLPYVSKIPKNLIDVFGLQGYPWPDPYPEHDPARFLSASMAIEAASALGAKSIWFSTGTFARGKAWNGQTYSLTPARRGEILNAIIGQAGLAKQAGFSVSLMLFTENKFSTAEGIDWSYWPAGNIQDSESVNIFRQFQNSAVKSGFNLGIFDS